MTSRGDHQPPQRVGAFGGEAHRRALEVQARAQDLLRFRQALRRARHAPAGAAAPRASRSPRTSATGSARCAMAVSMRCARPRVARQRIDGRELADREVGGRQRRAAHDAAFDEAAQRRSACASRTSSGISQPASCAIASRYAVSDVVARQRVGREVTQQTVAVEVGRQPRHHGVPACAIAQATTAAETLLLEAGVGIERHVLAHAVEPVAEPRAQRARRAPPRPGSASAGRCTAMSSGPSSCCRSSPGRCAPGTAGITFCVIFSASASRRRRPRRAPRPRQRRASRPAGTCTSPRRARGSRRRRARRVCAASRVARPAPSRVPSSSTASARALALRTRERRAEVVAFAHQRRQAGQQDEVLRRARCVPLPVPKELRAARSPPRRCGTRQRIVQRDRRPWRCLAHRARTRPCQSSSVSKSSRARSRPPPPPRRHGLATEVTLADHLHLRGGRLSTSMPRSAHHGVEQVPARVGRSSSSPSSTAASATSVPAGSAPPSARCTCDAHLRALAHAIGRALRRRR